MGRERGRSRRGVGWGEWRGWSTDGGSDSFGWREICVLAGISEHATSTQLPKTFRSMRAGTGVVRRKLGEASRSVGATQTRGNGGRQIGGSSDRDACKRGNAKHVLSSFLRDFSLR